MKNLKKLIYQYKFLKMELDDVKEEHSNLTPGFETLFADIIPPDNVDEDTIIEEAKKRDIKPKVKPLVSDSTKKVYKDVAKKLHPDAGGDDDSFKELNRRYKRNDLLGVISLAADNNIDFELSEDDEAHLKDSISQIEKQINHYKTTLAYVWENGTNFERRGVIQTLSNHFGKPIDIESLSDEIKEKIK